MFYHTDSAELVWGPDWGNIGRVLICNLMDQAEEFQGSLINLHKKRLRPKFQNNYNDMLHINKQI